LQFNAFLLAPFQVEVLFVMCTLLGGRRKIDTQKLFGNHGLIPILDDLFHRLPFSRSDTSLSGDATTFSSSQEQEESHGIHGPGKLAVNVHCILNASPNSLFNCL
jgi:hypothetical protein